MSTELELTPDRTKMLLVVYTDGRTVHRDRFDPVSAKSRAAVCREWGIAPADFFGWCEETRIHGGAKRFTLPDPVGAKPTSFVVRKMDEPTSAGVAYDMDDSQFVKHVLPSVPVTHVAVWSDAARLCCLDVDYHEGTPPDREWLTTFVTTRLCPKPLAWHFSRGGGLHLFYVAAGSLTAEELAACAALRLRSADSVCGLELKTVVRGPGDETVHTYPSQDTAAGSIDWFGAPEYDEADRDAWLESEGMECGRRYDHTKCPIDPCEGAEREPVAVLETGVYCFRCNGKGLTRGSRRAGFVPWASLLGSPSAGELGGLVRHMVHWGHARWVLTERYGFPEPLARLAYRAALKAFHEGQPSEALIPHVWTKSTDGLARVNDLWLSIDDSHSYPKEILPILGRLPVCMYVDADGKKVVDPATVCEVNQTKSIDRYGYRNIAVVHGFRLASRFLPDPDQTTVAVLNPDLRRAVSARRFPRYVPCSKRMNEEEAWKTLESVVPRVDRVYVRTLLASFGCAQETRLGLHPIMFISGVSAAGKSAMAQLAAGILGARSSEPKFEAAEDRFRESIRKGGQEGPVVVINEMIKDSGKGKYRLTPREALDFVLTATPHSTSHQLYKGPVKMGRLPALVLTETMVPEGLHEETQLARRIRHHYVAGAKRDWKKTIAAAGLEDLHLIRTVSDDVARACDAIMSGVVDDCFCMPETWDTIADRLGVHTIEESTDYEDPTPMLRELFRLVCATPKLTGRDAKVARGEGYKKIAKADTSGDEDSDLATLYSQFVPPLAWTDARKLVEKDWSKILGTDEVVRLDTKAEGATVCYLRFCVGPLKKPTKVNQQIVDPTDWSRLYD